MFLGKRKECVQYEESLREESEMVVLLQEGEDGKQCEGRPFFREGGVRKPGQEPVTWCTWNRISLSSFHGHPRKKALSLPQR